MLFLIASSISITAYAALYSYYMYSAYHYIRLKSDRSLFFVNSVITLMPPVIYSYNLINYEVYALPLTVVIQNFILEWSITTPLIILNITNFAKIRLYKQCIMCGVTSLMNICGYLANGYHEQALFMGWFAAGCVCFAILVGYIVWLYYKRNWVLVSDHPQYQLFVSILNRMFYVVIGSWSFYPVIFLLYKYAILNTELAAVSIMGLDFISKGLFIWTITRNQDLLYIHDSFVNHIRSIGRSAKVLPIKDSTTESPIVIEMI